MYWLSLTISLLISHYWSIATALAVLTGGKSHLEIITNTTHITPQITTVSSLRRTRITRPTRLRREISLIEEFASLQRNVSAIRPETINRFPPVFARMLATLFSNNKQRTPTTFDKEAVLGGDMEHRRKRQIGEKSTSNTQLVCPIEPPACQDTPFDALLPHDDFMFAFKRDKVYMLSATGEIVVPQPIASLDIFPGIMENATAVLRINDFTYVFFGSTYMKFRPVRRPSMFPAPVPVPSGFHGVPTPVKAAFKLNPHTYVFISGNRFVFYQPDGNPPVNPKYSPNSLKNIRNGPAIVDSAFNLPDGRRFITAGDMMYELDGKMQVINVQKFKRQADGTGWLDCPRISSLNCTSDEVPLSEAEDRVFNSSTEQPSIVNSSSTEVATSTTSKLQLKSSPSAETNFTTPTATPLLSWSKMTSVIIYGKPIANFSTRPQTVSSSTQSSTEVSSSTTTVSLAESSASAIPADDELVFQNSELNSTAENSTEAILLTHQPANLLTPSGNDGLKRIESSTTDSQMISRSFPETTTEINKQDPDGTGEVLPLDSTNVFIEKIPVTSKFIEQIEMQKAVLRELMAKLNNLTQIISQLPGS